MKSEGHVVLITGGATGLGFALAEKFYKAGNQVILAGRSVTALEKAVDQLPGAKSFACDVANTQDRARLVAAYPDISILINNAGMRGAASIVEATEEDLLQELRVNLLGPVLLARDYLQHLKQHKESAVINISSGAALVPREVAAMYSASKAALHSYTKSMRWQFEREGVHVFEVMPPVVRTAMTSFQKSTNKMLTTTQFADEFWTGFKADKLEMQIGNIRLLHLLRRLSPAYADKLVRKIPGEE